MIKDMCNSEYIIACFYRSVWNGKNLNFDLFSAIRKLGDKYLKIIQGWISVPFYP